MKGNIKRNTYFNKLNTSIKERFLLKNRLFISVLVIAFMYFLYSAIDFSPSITVEELESRYHIELSDLNLLYRKKRSFSFVTHDNIIHEFFGSMPFQEKNWYVSIMLADDPKYRINRYKSKYPEITSSKFECLGRDINVSICNNLWFDHTENDLYVPYIEASFEVEHGFVWICFSDNSSNAEEERSLDTEGIYNFLRHIIEISLKEGGE